MTQLRHREGFGSLLLVLAVLVVVGMWAFSSWQVSRHLMIEVARAEAGRAVHASCESAFEEALEGIMRSTNIVRSAIRDEDEDRAYKFGQALRNLQVGQMITSRFRPKNSRRAAESQDISIHDVDVLAFLEREVPGDPVPPGACAALEATIAKWSKVPG